MTTMKTDLEQVTELAQAYFDGLHRGEADKLETAFHKDAHIIGWRDGGLVNLTKTDFVNLVRERPKPSETGEAYDMKISGLDLSDTAGLLKVEVLYMGYRFTDFLSLLKTESGWVITNKTFRHAPRD